MGLPFVTRLPKDGGMHCPRDLAAFAHFICEACTVRSVLQRELLLYPSDTVLLMLERARLIDLTNHWARGTLKAYQSKFSILDKFSRDLHVSVLTPSTLAYPQNGEAIPLMWAQEQYSLYPSEWHRRVSAKTDPVKFGSIRAIRSAASHFWIWDLLLAHPDRLTLGFKDRPLVFEGCSPTDEAAYTFFTDGMRRRIGDNPQPSATLLLHHILWINAYFERIYHSADDDNLRINICRAALTHLLSFIGWLRAVETFGIWWQDLTIIDPPMGPTMGLPINVGVILLKLLAQTKSSQTAIADVVLAYKMASGLPLGDWFHMLVALLPVRETSPESFVLSFRDGRAWSSHHYRYTYMYPLLSLMLSLGDVCLSKYDKTPGRELIKAFHGFTTMRRTGRTVASKKRATTLCAATPAETVEHGRWCLSRSSLDMPLAYLEWPIADHICISQFCL
jgi:hypothetical protein